MKISLIKHATGFYCVTCFNFDAVLIPGHNIKERLRIRHGLRRWEYWRELSMF